MTKARALGTSSVEADRWDEKYHRAHPPPWEIGRPQSVVVELAAAGLLSGRVLDLGCGTGEHSILAAEHGAQVLGVDISPQAVKRAAEKARGRQVQARFEVADALRLDLLDEVFDVVIDSGMFHFFDADKRSLYASSLANVVPVGGVVYVTCISDRQEGDWGPRRVSEAEIRDTFATGWMIEELKECLRERRSDLETPAKAWLASIRRIGLDQPQLRAGLDPLDRERAEVRRLRLENDLLETEVIRGRLELGRQNGLTGDELAPLVRRLMEGLRADDPSAPE